MAGLNKRLYSRMSRGMAEFSIKGPKTAPRKKRGREEVHINPTDAPSPQLVALDQLQRFCIRRGCGGRESRQIV